VNTHLTNPLQPPTTTPDVTEQASKLIAAVNEAITPPTSYRDETPLPAIGAAPPVPQPGRPPMSQRAVDLNTTMLSAGVTSVLLGGATSLVLWTSGQADPTVVAWICASAVALPAAITVPVLALKGLMKSAKEAVQAAPPVIHQYYNGTVDQRHVENNSRGIWVKTTNQLPR